MTFILPFLLATWMTPPLKEDSKAIDDVIELSRRVTAQVSGEWNQGRRRSTRWGAGVLVGSGNAVITCLHIVEGYPNLYVRTYDDVEHRAELVTTFPDRDLAVLRFGSPGKYEGLTIADRPALVGELAIVVGYPIQNQRSLLLGKISSSVRKDVIYNGVAEGTPLLSFEAQTTTGFSGGPVISARGQFLGMSVARTDGLDSLALSNREILSALKVPQIPLPRKNEAYVNKSRDHELPESLAVELPLHQAVRRVEEESATRAFEAAAQQ